MYSNWILLKIKFINCISRWASIVHYKFDRSSFAVLKLKMMGVKHSGTIAVFSVIVCRRWGFKGLVRTGAGLCTLLPGRSGGPTMGSLADFTSLWFLMSFPLMMKNEKYPATPGWDQVLLLLPSGYIWSILDCSDISTMSPECIWYLSTHLREKCINFCR